jgi:uncharacterized protein YkwD
LARSGLLLTVVGVAVVLTVVFGGRAGGDTVVSAIGGAARRSGAVLSSTDLVDLRHGGLHASDVVDRGVVRGTVSLRTDVPPDPRTWVAYLIDGPTSTVRFAPRAPYQVDVDTRQLPDGSYTVDEVVFRAASAPRVKTIRLRVDNGSGAPPSGLGGAVARLASPQPGSTSTGSPPPPSGGAATRGPAPVPAPAPEPAPTSTEAASGAPTTAPPQQPSGGMSGDNMAAQVVELTNAERAKAGCPPLVADARLTAAAQAHSADMAIADYFSHDSQGGVTPFQRITAAGYAFSVAAENIAAGQRTPQDVVAGWMNSAGHRANIQNCSLVNIGVGYATGGGYGVYWTQDFGAP